MASRENLLEALTDPGTQATVNYDYLLFTPKLDSSNHYIYYTIEPKQSNPDSSALEVPNSVTQPVSAGKMLRSTRAMTYILNKLLIWSEVWALLIPRCFAWPEKRQPRYIKPVCIYLIVALLIKYHCQYNL